MSDKTTVETVSIADIKAGDTILRDGGERVTVAEIIRTYRDTKGQERLAFGGCALRVVPEKPEEPAEEELVWPDADLIRIIRGKENGNRIDGSLAYRIDGGHGFRLLDGPRVEYCVVDDFVGDAIYEWEEVVPVAKSAILASLGTTDDDPEDDDAESESEDEAEDEEECDGSCLACLFMRLIASAAAGKDKEGEE